VLASFFLAASFSLDDIRMSGVFDQAISPRTMTVVPSDAVSGIALPGMVFPSTFRERIPFE
jgi:hypothetical protein